MLLGALGASLFENLLTVQLEQVKQQLGKVKIFNVTPSFN